MKTTKSNNRRKFLLAAGLGSAGVAAAVVARGPAATAKADEAAGPAKSGYQATEHVLKYYKTTQV